MEIKNIIQYALAMAYCCMATVSPAVAQRDALQKAFKAAANEGFSGAVMVAEQGRPVLYKATGMRSYEDKKKLKKTDLFEMASVSKQFTAAIVLQLYAKGLFSLDDPIDKYVKVPYAGISIRHLLTHTSGLPDYQAIMDEHWDKTKIADNKDILAYLNQYHPPVLFAPGEKYLYSNTGYVLLASIAEAVSKEDFVALCKRQIFEPAGMRNTAIRTNDEKKQLKNFAAGHLKDSGGQYINANRFAASDYTIWLGGRKGPGRVSSTAADLLKWDQALYAGIILSDSLQQLAYTPYELNSGAKTTYGFGWVIKQHPQLGKYVMHTGDNPGYQTIIMRFIASDKTIIVLNNNAHPAMNSLVDKLVAAVATHKL